jgi:hypothetical protein
MKYAQIVLTIIALLLVAVVVKMYALEAQLRYLESSVREVTLSTEGIIRSNQRLEGVIADLNQQIIRIADRFDKK